MSEQIEKDKIYNCDCLEGMKHIPNASIDLVLTDIPYNEVNASDETQNGIRVLNKGAADVGNFDVSELARLLISKTRGSIYMFCGFEQVSPIVHEFRAAGLTPRLIVWEKTNPSPMAGEFTWLSGVEMCVFGKKSGATFNLHCQNTVLRYQSGDSKIHPTQKPIDMFRKLVLASSNPGDTVLDPFMGSGTTAVACIKEKRHFIGFELNKDYYDKACRRIDAERRQLSLF